MRVMTRKVEQLCTRLSWSRAGRSKLVMQRTMFLYLMVETVTRGQSMDIDI